VEALTSSLDANVTGLYLSLAAARHAGVSHAVYTSSMSIYDERSLMARYFADEEIAPDASDVYGFTKRLGEEVCRNACREWDMSINILRLCWPVSTERWQKMARPGEPILATAETDLARAIEAALVQRFGGLQTFMISGDYAQRITNLSKARRLLGWEPLARPIEAKE
jgi:nucleoside-diphosphate-sugar epimerase